MRKNRKISLYDCILHGIIDQNWTFFGEKQPKMTFSDSSWLRRQARENFKGFQGYNTPTEQF